MQPIQDLMWDKAGRILDVACAAAQELEGISGLRARFDTGERTADLYEQITKLASDVSLATPPEMPTPDEMPTDPDDVINAAREASENLRLAARLDDRIMQYPHAINLQYRAALACYEKRVPILRAIESMERGARRMTAEFFAGKKSNEQDRADFCAELLEKDEVYQTAQVDALKLDNARVCFNLDGDMLRRESYVARIQYELSELGSRFDGDF